MRGNTTSSCFAIWIEEPDKPRYLQMNFAHSNKAIKQAKTVTKINGKLLPKGTRVYVDASCLSSPSLDSYKILFEKVI